MEGAQGFQIPAEYQIYCLFYCFGFYLNCKAFHQMWQQIQIRQI